MKPPHLVPVDCLKALSHALLFLRSFLPFSFQPWGALQITPFLLVGDHSPNPSFSSIAKKLLSDIIFFQPTKQWRNESNVRRFGFIAILCMYQINACNGHGGWVGICSVASNLWLGCLHHTKYRQLAPDLCQVLLPSFWGPLQAQEPVGRKDHEQLLPQNDQNKQWTPFCFANSGNFF